ncbi:hypothetical protein [Bifidobacterium sp. AGR2158]|uniref:hypothetical protein n=1 Tax=Bifidobacterium sp. AGR2158 TaxID=1280675 RepID=UPI0004026D8D|nr:hypothetical protein [Bifidobacterium sp. AGR2158]
MAVNVTNRAATLEDVLAQLRAQITRISERIAADPHPDHATLVYTAGKLAALADASATVGEMLAALWTPNIGGKDEHA